MLGDVDLKGKNKLDLQRAVLEKVFPGKRFDSCSRTCSPKCSRSRLSSALRSRRPRPRRTPNKRSFEARLNLALNSAEESPLAKMQRATDARFANAFKR